MSRPFAHEAETLRLARVLGVAPAKLAFLEDVPVAALRELRGSVQDRLLERSRSEFERAVALAGRLPAGLAATLAQKAMGPVLGGRAAALLSPELAADLAARLPAEFLADVATHVDLRRVGPLVGGIPTETMAGAGTVLRAREEWIVLSAFVGHVPAAKLEALLALFDGEALLRAGFVIEDVDRLDAVVALLEESRLDELLAAAHAHALWREAIALAVHLQAEQRGRVVAAIERCPPDQLDELLRVAHTEGLWEEVVTVAGAVPAGGGDGILAAIGRLDEAPAAALATALREDDRLRETAAPLIARAPAMLLGRLGRMTAMAGKSHRAVGALIIAIMGVGSLILWIGIPALWLFAVSITYGKATPSLTIYALLLIGIPVTMVLFGQQLTRLNNFYERRTGRTSHVRVAAPWHRSTRGARDEGMTRSMLGIVMLISVAIAVAGLGVWFLFFASGGGSEALDISALH